MLLTRAPVAAKSIATPALPLDLHVLGLSLAFILSQDQTLRCISCFFLFLYLRISPAEIDFALSLVLLFFPVFSMNFALRLAPAPRGLPFGESVAKLHPFSFSLQIFYHLFLRKFSTLASTRLIPAGYILTFFSLPTFIHFESINLPRKECWLFFQKNNVGRKESIPPLLSIGIPNMIRE